MVRRMLSGSHTMAPALHRESRPHHRVPTPSLSFSLLHPSTPPVLLPLPAGPGPLLGVSPLISKKLQQSRHHTAYFIIQEFLWLAALERRKTNTSRNCVFVPNLSINVIAATKNRLSLLLFISCCLKRSSAQKYPTRGLLLSLYQHPLLGVLFGG